MARYKTPNNKKYFKETVGRIHKKNLAQPIARGGTRL